MLHLRNLTGIKDLTLYWARHTFASTARNRCRLNKDDVSLALNHVDEGNRVTDIYIEKDWKIVDDVQKKVMRILRKIEFMKDKPKKSKKKTNKNKQEA